MPKTLSAESEFLRALAVGSPGIAVDRENKIVRGMVLAETGPFKSKGRGEFNDAAIDKIVALVAATGDKGLKSRWTHPTLSADGLGTHLGRVKDPRVAELSRTIDGKAVKVRAALGDLHFNPTALKTPPRGGRPYGDYVMELAETDPDAFSTSLVIQAKKEYRLGADQRPAKDPQTGEELPPLWLPLALKSSDVVDTGDATNGFLSAEGLSFEGLPDALVRDAAELLDGAFLGQSREVVEKRVKAWFDRYLELRFEDDEKPPAETETKPGAGLAILRNRLACLPIPAA